MKTVKKPWGEETWLELNEHYCFKKIWINAGCRTSLQYHVRKHETNYVFEGTARITLENSMEVNDVLMLSPGDAFSVSPGRLHRVEAITDLTMFEVSTPDVDDVIRVEDDAGRPSGRIDSEHG